MTAKLTAYGAYLDARADVWCITQVYFEMTDERFLDWAKGPYHPVVGELINALPNKGDGRWRFFAWQPGDQLPADWRARVDRLLDEEEDSFFGLNAKLAREDLTKYPLYKPEEAASLAFNTKVYKYVLAQCWYEGATKADEGKSLGNEAMEAVRALSRGNG